MIDGLPVVNISATALLAVVFLMVITDRLVWYKRLRVLEKQILTKDALIGDLTKQNTLLLGSAIPTVNSVLGALQRAAGGDDG